MRFFRIPEGLKVLPDGSWRVGEHAVRHARSLQYLKQRLVFEDDGAFVVDGAKRMPVELQGPPFEVTSLDLDREHGRLEARLDDGSEETLAELSLNAETGRFECGVRGGRARAVLSRAAHQVLLEHAEHDAGGFALRVGARRVPLHT